MKWRIKGEEGRRIEDEVVLLVRPPAAEKTVSGESGMSLHCIAGLMAVITEHLQQVAPHQAFVLQKEQEGHVTVVVNC